MKKFTLSFCFVLLGIFSAFGQPAHVDVDLYLKQIVGTSTVNLGQYRVEFLDSSVNVTIPPVSVSYYSSAAGRMDTTYNSLHAQGRLTIRVYDCNGIAVFEDSRIYDTLFVSNPLINDTAFVNCIDPCEGSIVVTPVNSSTFQFSYVNHPSWSGSGGFWLFNGSSFAYGDSVTRSFTPGTHTYKLIHRGCSIDSGSVTVPLSTPNCMAEFIVDTVNSFNYQLVVWNVSSIDSNAATRTYKWNFGDGDSATGAFLSHSYANPGVYELKLSMSEWDAQGNLTCYSEYSDSVGMDAQGDLLYKTGFTLNVMDPNSIGIEEESSPRVSFYPQPARDYLSIESESIIEEVRIIDLSGRTLDLIKPNARNGIMHLHSFPVGIYVISIETELGTIVEKCIVH